MMDDGYMTYMTSKGKWTEWRERFAFFPKKLNDRWIWLKCYWERYRYDTYLFNKYGHPEVEMDYALNILDILRKS